MRHLAQKCVPGAIVLIAAALAGCAGSMGPEVAIEDVASFHSPVQIRVLKPGQRLRLVVFGAQELSGSFEIGHDGNLRLPKVGVLQVAGMSPQELEKLLAERLAGADGAPQVSVMLD